MNFKYNKARCIELSRLVNEMDIMALRKNKSLYREVLKYQVVITNHIHYQHIYEYLSILERFLNSSTVLDSEKFIQDFNKFLYQNEYVGQNLFDNVEELQKFEPDERADTIVSTLLSNISYCCDDFYLDSDEIKDISLVEKAQSEFKECVSSSFEELQKIALDNS